MTPAPLLKPVIPANPPARGTPGYLTLSSAFLDPRLAPVAELADCFAHAARAPSMFSDPQGYPPLREAIAARLSRAGIPARADHILITVGSQHALDLVCRSLISPRVATECPAYGAGLALLAHAGIATTPLPIDPFTGIDLARWRDLLAASRPGLAFLASAAQNPTGYAYTRSELDAILAWSSELDFGILEDDWASDMLPSAPRPTLRALGGDNVLYMNAFTKKALPSLRLGYLVGNDRTLPSLLQAKKLSINGAPSIVEHAVYRFLALGHYDAHLARLQPELAARRDHCLATLRAVMPPDIRWTSPAGGPVLWLELPRRIDIPRLIADLAERRVLVHAQDQAFLGARHLHGIMLGYGFLDRAEMTSALEILASLLR